MMPRPGTSRKPDSPDRSLRSAVAACLMLALRGALVGASWGWIAAAMAGAGAAHLADLALRWRR